ncbi:MAG: tRNA (adenosine(37)-N6)-threonylcarbamoyltransferase complex dimerization subunit type 1 TsaB [Candidatus Limnocylindrales bacterium]
MSDRLILAVDTSTRASIVALGSSLPLAISRREVRHRHGAHVLEQIEEVLGQAGRSLDDVAALAVGTGPGSFTGLRVGLATLKTVAYARELPLVGVMSSDALRLAATVEGAAADAPVVLPAGARDHYLAWAGHDPLLIASGELSHALAGATAVAVDVDPTLVGEEAARVGAAAVEGLAAALLQLASARVEAGQTDDVAELTPAYVALPRGVKRAAEDLGWSPDLR